MSKRVELSVMLSIKERIVSQFTQALSRWKSTKQYSQNTRQYTIRVVGWIVLLIPSFSICIPLVEIGFILVFNFYDCKVGCDCFSRSI